VVELRLRGDHSELLREQPDDHGGQSVDEVQRRQVLARQEQRAAEQRLDRDERLTRAQQGPEAARVALLPPGPGAPRAGREVDRDQRRAERDVDGGHAR
jgi:hypothetical protein